MQQLGKLNGYQIRAIPTTMENYNSFSLTKQINKCRISVTFLDSFQFLPTSLQKLVSNWNNSHFHLLKQHFPNSPELLIRKGIYPYEYIDSLQKFEEKELPPPDAFTSGLTGQSISNEDYEHAQQVWNTFNIKNLGEYHDLYVKTDVLQLADVFQNFRQICQQFYQIDCVRLLTAPGLAWQAFLKMTQQPLELFTDVDMQLFIEQGIRGGISTITKRYAQAKNKDLRDFDENLASRYIYVSRCQ